jgi:hypothetical protein
VGVASVWVCLPSVCAVHRAAFSSVIGHNAPLTPPPSLSSAARNSTLVAAASSRRVMLVFRREGGEGGLEGSLVEVGGSLSYTLSPRFRFADDSDGGCKLERLEPPFARTNWIDIHLALPTTLGNSVTTGEQPPTHLDYSGFIPFTQEHIRRALAQTTLSDRTKYTTANDQTRTNTRLDHQPATPKRTLSPPEMPPR